MNEQVWKLSEFVGQVAIVTGGGGILCSVMCQALAEAGAKVVVLDFNLSAAQEVMKSIRQKNGEALAVQGDVLNKSSLEQVRQQVLETYGRIDILINGAGGNRPQATNTPSISFFDLPHDAIKEVLDLNFLGTLLPCQVFGKVMAEQGKGVILNISSMSAYRPLTRVSAYSASKSAVSNFTQWLAVYMAQEHSPNIRVNAIAPGFLISDQNRYLLIDQETGQLTPRGKKVIEHTPMGRFGEPADLLGAVFWLLSRSSSFVTGIVVPLDGGFSAYSGV